MTEIPTTDSPDGTIAFLREGYTFAPDQFRRLGSDIFRTRLMLQPAWFVQGAEASEAYYHPGRFTRRKAMPVSTLKMLQDFGSVQTLSNDGHRHRKQMFLSMMGDDAIDRLVVLAEEEWRAAARRWSGEVTLLPEAQRVLCHAVCRWAGLALGPEDIAKRTDEFAAEVRGAGNVGATAWLRGAALRTRNERWARSVIESIRAGRLTPAPGEAAAIVANYRDPKAISCRSSWPPSS